MSTYSLTLRSVKGSKLTTPEMDNNLLYLQNLAITGATGSYGLIGNVIQVQKGTLAPGQFSSIKDAVDSINASSTSNPFVINIGPGIYIEDTIIMKAGISIVGESIGTVVVTPSLNTDTIIIGHDDSSIINLILRGADGTGGLAVYYEGTGGLGFLIKSCDFDNNETQVHCYGNTHTSLAYIDGCTVVGNCITGFLVDSSGGSVNARIVLINCNYKQLTGIVVKNYLIADGPSVKVSVTNTIIIAVYQTGTTCMSIRNGAQLILNASAIDGFETAIEAPLGGLAPELLLDSITITNSHQYDVLIQHLGTTGYYFGIVDRNKVLIPLAAPFNAYGQDYHVIDVALKGGDYTSIAEAVNSIVDMDIDNRYVIRVNAGEFIEPTIDLFGKPYVSITGISIEGTIIQPRDPDGWVINIGQNNELSYFAVENNFPGSGTIGVRCYDTGIFSQLHKVSFIDCDTGIEVTGNSQPTQFYGEYIDFNGTYSYGVKVVAENGTDTFVNLENYYNFPNEGVPAYGTFVSGVGSDVNILSSGIIGGATGIGLYVEDGGRVDMLGSYIKYCGVAVKVGDVGTYSSLTLEGSKIIGSTDDDLLIDHPYTIGNLTDGVLHGKQTIPLTAPFYISGRDPKIITVSVKGGDHTSINNAIDTILDASDTNRYTVSVGAGDYYEDTIVMKPYINVIGRDRTTRIFPKTSTQHIFIGSDQSTVIDCLVTGAGLGYAAFYHSSSTGSAQTAFVLKNIIFGENDTHVICYADTNRTTVQVVDSRYGGTYQFNTGFLAYNNSNSIPSRILLLHCYSQGMVHNSDPLRDMIFAKASGINCEIVMNSIQANAISISPGSVFLWVENGARCRLNAVNFTYWETGIYVPYIGIVPPTIIGLGVSCQNTTINIQIIHPDTIGNLMGAFNVSSVFNMSVTMGIVYLDPTIADFTIPHTLNIQYSPTVKTDVSTLISQSSTMGVIRGGLLSDGTSGLTVSIAEGFGYLHINTTNDSGDLQKIGWPQSYLGLPPSSTNYIYLNSNGILSYNPTLPKTSENILMGRVRTNSTTIEFIERSPLNAEHWPNKTSELFRKGFGSIYSSGSTVTQNSTPLHLDVTQGVYFLGSNQFFPAGGVGITFRSYRPSGSGGWVITDTSIVDNVNYTGTSSLIGLSASYYAKHSLYIIGDNAEEKYFLVYAQDQHAILLDAENANVPSPPSYFTEGVTLIAGIIVQQGTASIVEIIDQRPVIGFKSSGINAAADHSSLLNLTSDDHRQYLLSDGGRAMSGNLVMGSNSITGVNTINSININSHASRHLPFGADGLTTGTPSTINTTNQIGVQNAFARMDHLHAHGDHLGGTSHATASQASAGFMSSSDKIKLDNALTATASLSNKTISGSTNYVEADALKTSGSPVVISSNTPILGQTLIATSATFATWQTAPVNTGPQGDQGPQGTKGSTGSQGPQGPQGFQGENGTIGVDGATGPQGFQGENGTIGVDGATGTQGFQGNQGFQGSTGPQGTQGNQGFQGDTGPQGNQGTIGSQGVSGQSDRYQSTSTTTFGIPNVGSTVSLIIGTALSYTINQSTVVSHDTINFFQGSVFSYTPNNGSLVITCETATYSVGKTYSTWTINLSGAVGTQGPIGVGVQGATGSQGVQGTQGFQGATGSQGFQGTRGATGSMSATSSHTIPTDPNTTGSTVGVMMGLGLTTSITPILSGRVLIIISGDMDNTNNGNGTQTQIRWGTGAAPANGAALTGTTDGGLVKCNNNNAAQRFPFTLNGIVYGLTLNTKIWVDISLAAITGGTARVRDISISLVEI